VAARLLPEVFDVSGAGDTVVAALRSPLRPGFRGRKRHLANRAAAVVVGSTNGDRLAGRDADERQAEPQVVRRKISRLPRRCAGSASGSSRERNLDVLHAGHLHILKEAKQQGDVLVVGLNSDASVRSNKGPKRPVVPQAQRADMLLALRYVDYVHIFDEPVPMAFIAAVRPHVHVNGAEYGEDCVESGVVRELGARLHRVPRIDGLSTSALIERLANELQAARLRSAGPFDGD
jgi:D-beta-D-heptose 7-phosphate kinase/D-beta-D-heptose 1-phosphate adenosyltransferase